jgi:hypothetical protein
MACIMLHRPDLDFAVLDAVEDSSTFLGLYSHPILQALRRFRSTALFVSGL